MTKALLKAFVKLAIFLAFCPTTNTSSTTNKRIRKSPSSTSSQIHNYRLVFCGIHVPTSRTQTFYTIVEELVSVHTISSQPTYKIFFSFHLKTLELLHIDFLFQLTMHECCFNIQLHSISRFILAVILKIV